MSKSRNDDQIQQQIAQGDSSMAESQFSDALQAYQSAYQTASSSWGFLDERLLPLLEKLVEATYKSSDQEYYLKYLVKYLRSILAIKQRQHGIDSPELIPTLQSLVIFYDYDGAHMLAIEVAQRIDGIKAQQEISAS